MNMIDQILEVSEQDQIYSTTYINQALLEKQIRKITQKDKLKIFDISKKTDSIKILQIAKQAKVQQICCETKQMCLLTYPFDKGDRAFQKQEEPVVKISIKEQNKIQKKQVQDNEPKPFKWIQKRPYQRIVTEYEQKIIKVPVKKVITAEYQIQHIVEYIKKKVNEIEPELEKRQHVDLKLNYQPVDRLIIHIPQNCINQNETQNIKHQYFPKLHNKILLGNDSKSTQKANTKVVRKCPKRYSVTFDNYDFNLRLRKWDLIIDEIQHLKQKQRALFQLKAFN